MTPVPVPIRQFVLKVHSRCNLACTYCYIYEGPDTSWRQRPVRVSPAVMRRTARRIAEHVRTHRLPAVRLDLHGGEPLLGGAGPLVDYVRTVREALPSWCALSAGVQTNGTLLTESALTELRAAGIRIGLSADGGTPRLNRRRTDHAGRSSYPAVARAARLLAARPESYAGILCTIDLASPPAEVYRSLAAWRPPMLDFLLPHANWSSPPPRPEGVTSPSPYGDWLCTVFDLWWDSRPPGPRIRLFSEIIGLLFGRPGGIEAVGLSPVATLVIETDGTVEQVDSLRSAHAGASATGLDVFRHDFDTALTHSGVAARQRGIADLGRVCRECALLTVCGGGNYVHRYREGSGFRHPSVYCADLERLIRYIAARLGDAMYPLTSPEIGYRAS
ncbi:FxsB family cyclophane-forming radical SAM/SPASM peptide maturase [Streptomyces sp. NPDC051940]|uniref:FxsB family cyclophane-forming radical SAM/SPASM peptide maturase n=1 Tax=Streptomyces sp. NPDC051940 TaxID=3155675 RepID=UPI0034163027